MAFTAKMLSWRFRHLNIVGCLVKRRPTKGGGGSRAPQDPPSYAPDVQMVLKSLLPKVKTMQLFRRTPQKETLIVKKRHISQFKEFNWDHPGPMEVV